MKILVASVLLAVITTVSACSNGGVWTGGSVAGNEGGSEPVNSQEAFEFQKAVNRCHRTGGTRVVKIKGELKCY
jgi:hypothetical protein